MATLLGGINKDAVAPAMTEMVDSVDQQLNDPNAYYSMPDENLLLHTNRAYDMADRGQIARSEVPVRALLNSNTNDSNTQEKALGLDIQGRKRYASPENKVEMLTPEQFTKTLGEESAIKQGVDAGIAEAQAQNTMLGTSPVAAPNAGGMVDSAASPQQMLGTSTTPTEPYVDPMVGKGYLNTSVPTGNEPREFGYNEGESQVEAEIMAKAVGWDPKTATTTEKRINADGDIEERTITKQPYIQQGFDEGMGVNTPRLGYENVDSGWNVIKKATKPKASSKTPPMKVFQPNFKVTTLKDQTITEMAQQALFNKYTEGKSIETKQAVQEFSKLSAHKFAMAGLDDDARRNYMSRNKINSSYTEISESLDQMGKQLQASGVDITNEIGAQMYNEASDSATGKYTKYIPIGESAEKGVIFPSSANRVTIQYGSVKRYVDVGFDEDGAPYYKFTMKNTDTGMPEEKVIAKKNFTADMETQFLDYYNKSGNRYYGEFGSGTTDVEVDNPTNPVSYFKNEEEKNAYNKAMEKVKFYKEKLATTKTIDEAVALYNGTESEWNVFSPNKAATKGLKKELEEDLKDYPTMLATFSNGYTPVDRNGDDRITAADYDDEQLLKTLSKKQGVEKGLNKQQEAVVKELAGTKSFVSLGGNGKKTNVNYTLQNTNDGIVITVGNGGNSRALKTLIPLNFVTKEDINTRAGEIILDEYKLKDPEYTKILNTVNTTHLK